MRLCLLIQKASRPGVSPSMSSEITFLCIALCFVRLAYITVRSLHLTLLFQWMQNSITFLVL